MEKFYRKLILSFLIFSAFFFAGPAAAVAESNADFFIEQGFDASSRTSLQATLVKTTEKIYFYIEKDWWNQQTQAKKEEIFKDLDRLSAEFQKNIYPTLTSVLGSEWNPGVDGDSKITVLFHLMKEGSGGYFRSSDEYLKMQISDSNEKEMVYMPIAQIQSSQLKVFLAHEFVHLLTFNQKEKIFGASEDVWLNEARADYSASLLGYNLPYEGSNLQKRSKDFLEKTSDSITEWQGTKYDYASVGMFTQYIVDHYTIAALIDSLKSKYTGIQSIDYALSKNGYAERFKDIFTDWTIAILINNCSAGKKYCYLNENLKNFRINPTLNFLPLNGTSSLSVTNVIKDWGANWQKIIGGKGDLKLKFSGLAGLDFKVPYIIYDKNNDYAVKFLQLDKNQKGEINIKNFGQDYTALIIIPSLQSKTSKFTESEITYPYTFSSSIAQESTEEEKSTIEKLLAQIELLKKQLAELQSENSGQDFCYSIKSDLYFGLRDNSQVKCLQQFLKDQGKEIYPEGLVTGNFGKLTKFAVMRFQQKYFSEILAPAGVSNPTGYVGTKTRDKINEILNKG